MYTSKKIRHLLVTSYGTYRIENSDLKAVSILEFMQKYSNTMSYWLYAVRYRKYKSSEKAGKWMLFIKDSDLEYCWEKLLQGIDLGLYDIIKCSVPNVTNPNYTPGVSAIMVYTNNYENKVEIHKVLNYLLSNGLDFGSELFYKSDEQTRAGKYSGGRGESWLYSSKDF